MVTQPLSILGPYLVLANGSDIFLLEGNDDRWNAYALPDLLNGYDSAPSYWFVGVHHQSGLILGIDVVFHDLIEIKPTAVGYMSVRHRWPQTSRKPGSIAFVSGRWWVITSDEQFGEKLAFIEARNGDLPPDFCSVEVDAPHLPLHGSTNLLSAGDRLVLFDSILGTLCWLNTDLRVVDSAILTVDAIVGQADEGLVAYEPIGDGFRVRHIVAPGNAIDLFVSQTRQWGSIDGIAMLGDGAVVVVDENRQLFICPNRADGFLAIQLDWREIGITTVLNRRKGGG